MVKLLVAKIKYYTLTRQSYGSRLLYYVKEYID